MQTSYTTTIETERQQRAQSLLEDRSWFTLAGLFWLGEGENRFGTDAANSIVLTNEDLPAVAGAFHLHKGEVTVTPEPNVKMLLNGEPIREQTLQSDMSGEPDFVELGTLSFLVIKRGARIGIRIFDTASERRQQFKGLDWYPIDSTWQVTATFKPYEPPKPIAITNILGDTHEAGSPGKVVFEREGRQYELDAEDRGSALFFNFQDGTNKDATYGAGRFLSADLPVDGKVILDFNRATNPYCAYTSYATCPLPPLANRLDLRVEAGEKRYGG